MSKLQYTGRQYTLTIPLDMVERHAWKEGDTIDFVNSGKVIVLQKREKP